ncbi:hypothetical protein B0E43_02815 [Algoriphagus sp. A40]|nr:hypothetical protein B0E43_02815 [Algoriphagus sp. A40]
MQIPRTQKQRSSGFAILKPCLGIFNSTSQKDGFEILKHVLGISNSKEPEEPGASFFRICNPEA